MGEPKAPLVVHGERLVDRSCRVLREAGCSPVVAVLGAWRGEVPNTEVIVNEQWQIGMGSSLQVGLDWLRTHAPLEITRVAITTVDIPGLTVAAVTRLLEQAHDLGAATYQGVRGHPVIIGREHWAQVELLAQGDRGARDFLATRSDLVLVEVGDLADGSDVDTREDLLRFQDDHR